MQATIVDLRYKTREVLSAVERREEVIITDRGKEKYRITSIADFKPQRKPSCRDFDFIGSDQSENSIEQEMNALRGGRYADI